jgi:hypothetical protein
MFENIARRMGATTPIIVTRQLSTLHNALRVFKNRICRYPVFLVGNSGVPTGVVNRIRVLDHILTSVVSRTKETSGSNEEHII